MSEDTEFEFESFRNKLFNLGNHQQYGLFAETFERRFNELLDESKQILELDLSHDKKTQVTCWQAWILGNMAGLKFRIYDGNQPTNLPLLPS